MELKSYDTDMMSGTEFRTAIDGVREYDTVRLWEFEIMRLNGYTTKRRSDDETMSLRDYETIRS